MNRQEIFDRIDRHRDAMEIKHGKETLMHRQDIALAVLVEEVGEIARAMLEETPERLKEELFDVAQCIVAWLEGLE